MEFCGVAVGFGELGNVHVVILVEYVAYNFVSSAVFVVFVMVVNCWFVAVSLFFVGESAFVSVIR